ncbi:efflux RND transporter permease subunit [Marivibrio halodurans]|uniref:Efflux RND transporter permease subunit n=1 Tax=Marivibrio halodurans TaxID=2039722 RepID=A0A8J7SJ08_9PROT|nr:efflux RND transporter permease subunit [Marivibrio halodurans]MBP5857393.1 efflux RND transporter permease subunit [Marivibrio halodurans]
MSPIDAALDRSRTVLSLLLFILIAGFIAYATIPKEADPDVNIPIIYVSMHHEGISPEDAERLLVRPMEQQMQSIEGLKELRSTGYQGGANVLAEFEAGFDADEALQDVREKVDIAKPELPEETDEPTVNEVNLSLFPVLVVTLSGPAPERTLLRLARTLQDEIESIPSVLEARITGDREESVELLIDPAEVESYGLEPADLFNKIDRSNQLIAAGALDTGAGRFSIKVPGLYESVDDILNQPLVSSGESVVRVRDLAEVRRTFKDPTQFARVDGERAIGLEVSKRTGENIIETIEAVRALVTEAATRFPETVEVSFSQDKSEDIRTMLKDLQNNVISAVLLVMVVIVGALGVRGGLLVGIAIPGSFLAGILVLSIAGLTVNIVVLFSLILAVGMLVDGAIVVTEYADRKLAEGESKDVAYGLAAKRMAWPIIASTATTLAAFLPLLFWPGIVGEFMKFLPITLIATLSASLAMALIFVPVLGARLGGVVRIVLTLAVAAALVGIAMGLTGSVLGWMALIVTGVAGVAGLVLGWWLGGIAGRLVERQDIDPERAKALAAEADEDRTPLDRIGGFTGGYLKLLGLMLRAPGTVLFVSLLSLVGVYAAYGQFGKGVEFFPSVEPEQLIVNIHARGNMAVREKDALVREVEADLLAMQAERGEFHTIYTAAGIFQNRDDEAEDIIGKIQLEFVDWEERRPAAAIKREIRERTADLAGLWVEVREPEAGPPTGKPVHVQLSARDPSKLDDAVRVIRDRLESMPGLVDLEDSRPIPGIEWKLSVDRAQAAKFDADISLIGSFIQLVTKGLKVSEYRPDDSDDEVDISARFPEEYRTIDQLDRLRINTGRGQVPVGNFVERSAQQQTGVLNRVDSRRIMYVRADVAEGVLPDDKVREIRAWLDGNPGLPEGVNVEFKGEDEEQKKAQEFLVQAFAVALFLMAVILVTQFNSFYSAFLILSAVVMSTVGVLLGLMAMGEPFGIVMSGIGVIALAGIVVNNNIVLIDTFDRLKLTSPTPREAILRTGAQRLRPVMLTTVTTILGLMPMVLQTNIDFVARTVSIGAPSTQWWVQLSTAIVFGLAFATVLTLLVTPSALMVRANIQTRRARKADGTGATAQPAE